MNWEQLFTSVSNINKKYEEIYKGTGEKFNIFNVLNLSYDEISHSRFIAMLLNPKEKHGKDNKFIELFLKCIGIKDFSIDNIYTEVEKSIGDISENGETGGRIDVELTNDKGKIIIENKIGADDQPKQLLRYHNYNPKAHLLYLTLEGKVADEISTGGKTFPYQRISYKDHILKWLELCQIESKENPLLDQTLTQYIILIKELTGQGRSKEMRKEYVDTILKDKDNVLAAFIISENMYEIKSQILEEKFLPLIKNVAEELGMKANTKYETDAEMSSKGCFEKYWHFTFKKQEWKKVKIFFAFDNINLHNLHYGFLNEKNIPQPCVTYLQGEARKRGYESNENWPLCKWMDDYRYWDKDFFVELYTRPNNISNVLKKIIKELLEIVEGYKGEM